MRKTKQVSILLLAKMAVNIVRAQHNTFFSCRGRRRSDGGVGLDLDGGAAAEKQTHPFTSMHTNRNETKINSI